MSSPDTLTSLVADGRTELREGYAEIGDVRLHYAEAGDGPHRPAARLPGVLVRVAAADCAARGGRFPRGRARPARLQPVVEARRRGSVHRRQAGRRRARSHPRARCRVRVIGGPRLGRDRRLDCGDEPPRGGGPAGHSQRGPSAQAERGTASPQPARAVLVLLLLRAPRSARAPRAREGLGVPPALPARRPAAVHEAGDRPLYRGVVAGGRSGRDDRLLPRRGSTAEGHQDRASADLGADPGHLGPEGSLPRARSRRAPPRGRPQSRPRRAPARRAALGPPRRGPARESDAERILRPRARKADRVTGEAPTEVIAGGAAAARPWRPGGGAPPTLERPYGCRRSTPD